MNSVKLCLLGVLASGTLAAFLMYETGVHAKPMHPLDFEANIVSLRKAAIWSSAKKFLDFDSDYKHIFYIENESDLWSCSIENEVVFAMNSHEINVCKFYSSGLHTWSTKVDISGDVQNEVEEEIYVAKRVAPLMAVFTGMNWRKGFRYIKVATSGKELLSPFTEDEMSRSKLICFDK